MDRRLLDYASPRQAEYLKYYWDNNNAVAKTARHFGVSEATVNSAIKRVKQKAGDKGYEPDTGRDYPVGPTQIVSGYSDLVKAPKDDPLGRIIYWVKQNRKLTEQLAEVEAVVAAMAQDIPKVKPVVYKGNAKNGNHFSVLPIGDPHIGLLTWAKEVVVDWDVKIALRVYAKVFKRLLERTPDTEEVIIFNSGDFFHADNIVGETTRSKHKLDLDGRPGYWLDAGIVLLKMFIKMCLQKYKTVHFVNTPGNHDDILGRTLGYFVKHMYEDEPRLTCQVGDDSFQYVERGNVALGFAHGHTCKLAALPGKMADDQAPMWGRTTHRHWFTCHVHHNQLIQFKENPGCTVESVGIVPPKDAYAYGGAFGGKRGTQLCIFDKKSGYMPDRYAEPVLASD